MQLVRFSKFSHDDFDHQSFRFPFLSYCAPGHNDNDDDDDGDGSSNYNNNIVIFIIIIIVTYFTTTKSTLMHIDIIKRTWIASE